ncbi:MAG: branched-chain amino acid transport system substrate-binding protein [Actinomycetota bacterium]
MRLRGVCVLALAVAIAGSACGARFDRAEGLKANQGTGLNGGGLSLGTTDTTLAGDGSLPTGITDQTLPGGATVTTLAGSTPGVNPAVASVEPGPATGVTATTIKLGYLLPLTGAAPVPSNFDKGANVYWNYVNSKGGINGRKVSVVIRDTQSSASVGKQEAQKLIEDDKVFAIVVLDRLENQKALGAYLDGRNFPNIQIQTPANLDANQKWTFGITIDHAVQGALIADYFVKVLGLKKVAVVYENTSELVPGKEAFVKRVAALGGQVTYSKAIEGQDNDYSSVALDLSQSDAKATWLYMAPTPAAKIANQCAVSGYHPIWFANSISWGFDLVFTVAPTALQNARAFSPWLPLSDPRTKTYQDAYRAQTGENPDDLGIVGWGVGQIVGEAIKRTPNPLGQNNFRATFQALDFKPDIWVPVKFGATTREGANFVAVLKESGGKWALERDFTSGF